MPETGVGERDLHLRFPGPKQRGIAQRGFELAVGLVQPRFEQRDIRPRVRRAGPQAHSLSLVVERLAQIALRERIGRLERQRADLVEPGNVFEVGRLAGIELARFAQPAVREGPFLDRGLAALRFPGFEQTARLERAQIGKTAWQREYAETGEGGEKNAARNSPQLGLAVLPVPPPPAPAPPVGVLVVVPINGDARSIATCAALACAGAAAITSGAAIINATASAAAAAAAGAAAITAGLVAVLATDSATAAAISGAALITAGVAASSAAA